MNDEPIGRREKATSLIRVAKYRPLLTAGIIVLSFCAALLEAVGLSFLLPIIELVQGDGDPGADGDLLMSMFVQVYDFLGIPFTLEYVIVGVTAVMFARFSLSFGVAWLRASLKTNYIRDQRADAFDFALDARTSYFDREGSDDILNAIITQTKYVGRVIETGIKLFQELLLSLMYLVIAFVIAPGLTLGAAVVFGGITFVVRYLIEPGYEVGNRVADANETVQQSVQAGTQGIRDVKLFNMKREVYHVFERAVDKFADATISLERNEAAIDNFYQFVVAASVFIMIYVALVFADLSLGALGVFLFAMFRLAPRVSRMNSYAYNLEGDLPHLVRTQLFLDELERNTERQPGGTPPESIQEVTFEDVSFSYDTEEDVLKDISFAVDRDEFIAFVGHSGAGKSTIVSLLARMYDPTSGTIRADGTAINEFDIDEWREKIAIVRQDPYIFNDTLRYNLTIGNRTVSQSQLDTACEISKVSEFFDELPAGYDTNLGDNGVQLSGGQRQRVALARALLKDADILILDEATSDLDSHLEGEVHAGIEAVDSEYATIAIAHRLSTVRNADRIYTVEDGEITEVGDHEELIETGGTYAELYAIQSQG